MDALHSLILQFQKRQEQLNLHSDLVLNREEFLLGGGRFLQLILRVNGHRSQPESLAFPYVQRLLLLLDVWEAVRDQGDDLDDNDKLVR